MSKFIRPKDEEFEVIHSYSRQQAIEDGVLVDLNNLFEGTEAEDLSKRAGFRFPVAITLAAFQKYIVPSERDLSDGQSVKGRLWDMLNVLRFEIKKTKDTDNIGFSFLVQKDGRISTAWLKCVCGPSDSGEPVLTVMLPGED